MAVPPARDGRRLASAWAASLCAHAAVAGVGAMLVARSLSPDLPPPPSVRSLPRDVHDVDIELPPMTSGAAELANPLPPAEATPIPRGGGETTPRPDTGHAGRGGADTSERPAINLADRDDRILLSPDVMSRFDRSQVQRIDANDHRASREDHRASREPMELTFLAMGVGARSERRTPAEHDPSAGARGSGVPGREGGALGAAALPPGVGDRSRDPGGAVLGGARPSPGAGVRDGVAGDRHHDAADVARGRPLVEPGTPSVPANAQGKPSDDVDSEQEVATMVQSLVHASTAGGAPGAGPGGQAGPGAPGSGGSAGPGSRAHAMGTGTGTGVDVDPRDKRRTEYIRRARSKIGRFWSFPKWAALEGMQGTAIVTFTIHGNGTVSGVSVTRPSGIPEYDEICRRAVLSAAPFEPLPSELGSTFRWSMPFEARNPAVRPKSVSGASER